MQVFNPAKPDQIVKELFSCNNEITDNFSKNFPTELLEFAEFFSKSYKKFLELEHTIRNSKNDQKAYCSGLIYLLLDNLFTSTKLYIFGYQIPSGNLMRQAIEGIALACLCSVDQQIFIDTQKTKRIHFYSNFIQDKRVAQSHKAIDYLELNSIPLGINRETLNSLKKVRKIYHNYSHPSKLALYAIINYGAEEKIFMGGGFDSQKLEIYRQELINKIVICKLLPQVIEWLIRKIKILPE